MVGTTTATCLPVERGDEGGAERDLGLAEADVAADQPVHRPAGAEIFQHRVDRGVLVLGLLIGEARGEFVVEPVGRRQAPAPSLMRVRAATFIRASAMSRMRFLSRAFRVCQPTPPSLSSVDLGLGRAVAGQELDVLDREIDPVAAGIDDLEAVMRRAGRLDGTQAR